MRNFELPDIHVPEDMAPDEMPDLLRYWYLGSKARHHMALRRFREVDVELDAGNAGPVLDIGSAWGYNVMALTSWGMTAVGMDLVVDQFGPGARIARANGLPFVVLGADAACLPFADATFGSITMVETFEHVFETDRVGMLSECHRVLRPGGRIVLSTPNYRSLVEWAKRIAVRHPWLQRRLPTMCYPAPATSRTEYHPYRYHRPWSDGAIADALAAAGFDPRKRKFFLFTMKNTPDRVFGLARLAEDALERTPLLKHLAATVCIVADKPPHGRPANIIDS